MNEALILKMLRLATAAATFTAEFQKAIALLKQAQAEGRDVTQAEIDAVKSAERLAAEHEAEMLRQAGG